MISVAQTLNIHNTAIKKFGSSTGIRDMAGLESALARPFQTFDGNELYATFFEKAAALGESIIMNHPFVDGNKRTGYLLMEALLRANGVKIIATDEDLYTFIINISTGSFSFDQIATWLQENSQAF